MYKLTVIFSSLVFFIACGELDKPQNEIVAGGEIVVNVNGATIKKSLIDKKTSGIDENTTVYGYKAYKIPYVTKDEEGNSIKVSGLFVIPTGVPDVMKSSGFSMVSDSHGTIFANEEAPSVIAQTQNAPDGSAVILTSLFGFATLQADYIGFGDSSSHYHPFILKKSLANASIDFIKAVKSFALDNSINLNGQLFLTGYSEGGYTAMATLEQIEKEGELSVTLTAPMAGPYALEAMAMGVLNNPTLSVPSFMANVGYSYAKAFDEDIASVISEPYASKLEGLFDGSHLRQAIDSELSTETSTLFEQSFITQTLTDPNFWFRQALVANSVHAWIPSTAVRLVHCEGDDVIPYAISQLTLGTMQTMGVKNIDLVPVESTLGLPIKVGHSDCGALAYTISATMFADTRKASVGY